MYLIQKNYPVQKISAVTIALTIISYNKKFVGKDINHEENYDVTAFLVIDD